MLRVICESPKKVCHPTGKYSSKMQQIWLTTLFKCCMVAWNQIYHLNFRWSTLPHGKPELCLRHAALAASHDTVTTAWNKSFASLTKDQRSRQTFADRSVSNKLGKHVTLWYQPCDVLFKPQIYVHWKNSEVTWFPPSSSRTCYSDG